MRTSVRDPDYVKLFKWAIVKHLLQTKDVSFQYTPESVVRLLSVEGVREELKVSEASLPILLEHVLRKFRKLGQPARLSRATRLLKEWKEPSK